MTTASPSQTWPGALPCTSSSAAGRKAPRFESGIRELAQAQDDVARRQRRAHGPGRAGLVTAAALGAGVEVQELLPGEIGDLGDARRLLGCRYARQALRRLRIAHHQRSSRREDVLDLGERNQRDEGERHKPVKPPQSREPQRAAAMRREAGGIRAPRATSAPTGDHQRVSHTSGSAWSHTRRAASSTYPVKPMMTSVQRNAQSSRRYRGPHRNPGRRARGRAAHSRAWAAAASRGDTSCRAGRPRARRRRCRAPARTSR